MSACTPGLWINSDGLVNGLDSRERFSGTPSIDIFDASEWPVELQDEAQANAHLIAAAQDLLSASRQLLVIAGTPITERQEQIFRDMRAAIAKAEGRPS